MKRSLIYSFFTLLLLSSCDPSFNYMKDIGADKIVFAYNFSTQSDICVMNLDCSGFVNLTNTGAVTESSPRWSPDGSRIAFVRTLGSFPGYYYHIFVMNADGSSEKDLMTDQSDYTNPAWSPDGKKIAFESSSGIQSINADGSGMTPITDQSNDLGPSWSPDGTKIVFSRYTPSSTLDDIYIINSNGTGVEQMTDSGSTALSSDYPAWSPDGNEIVYQSSDGSNFNIYLMLNDGSGQTNLTNNSIGNCYHPQWSPGGSQIVFYNSNGGYQIYMMNGNGTGIKAITNSAGSPNNGASPSWWGFKKP
jgi:Tol biopolymer transport system component